MARRFSLSLLTVLSLLFSASTYAEDAVVDRLTQFVDQVQQFQARFQQVVADPEGQIVEQAAGVFYLSRPGKFRWDYHTPYAQQIVADGQQIWFYDEDLEQITVKNQSATLADTPAGLLSGKSRPDEAYHITRLNSDDGLQWVELTPKEADANYQRVQLGFSEQSLQQMRMVDAFDQQTRLVFSEANVNQPIAAEKFQFVPPQGVDVIGESP
ncbi:Outer membrane lipoprotein carrier protein LolA [Methylophaga frappieri]|uniref:Outer-membrane lipoprotein carrier protein n=1 Tax=Methylophaga frappieri (strain ATCC BAA-2434 / DSM 25690 / JAM7) TaxID=754477 RepID=I1YIQ6_METFJ|nr:outer membrane lipoprotein chaperone LolA [Methylophaga frappieri]AFJ02799.1 Outer membrane lipoprotein carrier protein LolA [Methylophaga frappieri]